MISNHHWRPNNHIQKRSEASADGRVKEISLPFVKGAMTHYKQMHEIPNIAWKPRCNELK